MNIKRGARGVLVIDDARITFRNFAGRGDKFNREGDRNFALLIPDEELAHELMEDGWNVKIKPPRDIDDTPFMYLPVKIKFNDRGPIVYLKSGERATRLDEESIACLDDIDILRVDMDLRPYDWEMNGSSGRTAYLQGMDVEQRVDRFSARYQKSEEDVPF